MAKKKNTPSRKGGQQITPVTPADTAASFIAQNIYRHRYMSVQDSRISPWDVRDSLIKENPGNLYEVKNTADGDVVSVNDGDAIIYAGNSAFSDNARSALIVDDFIRDQVGGKSPTRSPFVTFVLIVLIVLVIIMAL